MSKTVRWLDRFVSAITYLTAGWGGLIYSVLMYFARKRISDFAKFNIFQSIFVSLLYFCTALLLGFILQFLSYIPGINYLVAQISFLLNRPIIGNYSIIQSFIAGLVIYMAGMSLFGKYPRVYWLSKIIDRQVY